jgi:hypothetical protein
MKYVLYLQRPGPDHIGVSRVSRKVLRPGALTPDPRPAGTDALHVLTIAFSALVLGW